jgi:RimJ/RimL family protein N-acetyltransferase
MAAQLNTSRGILTIRRAEVEDAARLRELRLEALVDTPEAFAADLDASAAEPVEWWIERIEEYNRENSSVICLAESGDKLVGMTGLGRGHWRKTRHSGVIWGVYVNPNWRGNRIAEALIGECVSWGCAYGISVVKLGVITSNPSAIHCYLRCGFTVYGVDPQAIYYNDQYYDELLMSKCI